MTRLKTEWIEYMLTGMDEYNRQLASKTGYDLAGLVRRIYGVSEEQFRRALTEYKITVVPITQGEGLIDKFSMSVAAILASMGFESQVSKATDVNGLYEGWVEGSRVFFMADDDRYIGLNMKDGRISDNNYATAYGFIRVLEFFMEKNGFKLGSEKVLLIGKGVVGTEGVKILDEMGVDYRVADKDESRLAGLSSNRVEAMDNIKNYRFILDFTDEGEWLRASDVMDDMLYVSPGVPCSFVASHRKLLQDSTIYDNLEIGTAVMLGQVLFDMGCGSD